jgi:hypothetical protein
MQEEKEVIYRNKSVADTALAYQTPIEGIKYAIPQQPTQGGR